MHGTKVCEIHGTILSRCRCPQSHNRIPKACPDRTGGAECRAKAEAQRLAQGEKEKVAAARAEQARKDHVARIIAEAEAIPGVAVITGVGCRAMAPAGPEVHNLHMVECHGKLVNHEGPHSWEE